MLDNLEDSKSSGVPEIDLDKLVNCSFNYTFDPLKQALAYLLKSHGATGNYHCNNFLRKQTEGLREHHKGTKKRQGQAKGNRWRPRRTHVQYREIRLNRFEPKRRNKRARVRVETAFRPPAAAEPELQGTAVPKIISG